MESSSLESMNFNVVSFPPELEGQVAVAVARCKTLVRFIYPRGASPSFCDHYCADVSNNVDAKLERLRLYCEAFCDYDLNGDHGEAVSLNTAMVATIRLVL